MRLELGPAATPVTLLAAGGREIDIGAETRGLVEAVCALSDRVRLEVVEHEEPGPWPQHDDRRRARLPRDAGRVRADDARVRDRRGRPRRLGARRRRRCSASATLDADRRARRLRHPDLTALPAGRAAGDTLRPRVTSAVTARRDRGLGVPRRRRPPRRPRRARRSSSTTARPGPASVPERVFVERLLAAAAASGYVGRPVSRVHWTVWKHSIARTSCSTRTPALVHARAAGRRRGVRRPHAPRRRHRRDGRRPRRAARDPARLRHHALVHVLPRRARPPPGVHGRERPDARARRRAPTERSSRSCGST